MVCGEIIGLVIDVVNYEGVVLDGDVYLGIVVCD